nr:uncharacterized protein LOC123757758 [Procambarus clarkii]
MHPFVTCKLSFACRGAHAYTACVLESGGGRSGSEAGLQAVYQCALSGEGSQLFLEAGRRQHQLAPALLQVPVVAIDDVVVVEKKADLDTFSELLCRHLQHRILTPQARVFCRQVTARPPASSALTVG